MIFDKLFEQRSLENPQVSLSTENAVDELFGGGIGRTVSPDIAMKSAAVYACVNVLASSLAQLPLHVLRKEKDKIESARDHPLFYLLHDNPNFWQTSYKMREYNQSAVLLYGNAYLHIERNHQGEVMSLETREPWLVQLLKNGNRYVYGYYSEDETLAINPDEMIHIKALGTSLKQGKSIIQQHAETIGLGLDARDFAKGFFNGNARPSGIVTMKQQVNANAWDNFKKCGKKPSWNYAKKRIKPFSYLRI